MNTDLLQQRIAQWENMTQQDPENAMGWFSLGNAYREADRDEEAGRCFRKAIELDTGLSRAYQLLGQILVKSGANDQAAEVMTKGYVIAAERGDVMPMRAMGSLLEKIGKPVPETKQAAIPEPEAGGDQMICRRTNEPGPRLTSPPLKGPMGEFIVAHYSATTWRQWIAQGTKVINELRLDFSNPEHRATYDLQMMEWLGFTREDVEDFSASQS